VTKTEYREYIASEDWQQRRKEFLLQWGWECNRCGLPRELAIIAYDQDIHVHHRSYANLGSESYKDLEPLRRRCHDIETFGSSNLHEPKKEDCIRCGLLTTWNRVVRLCDDCIAVCHHPSGGESWLLSPRPPYNKESLDHVPMGWKIYVMSIYEALESEFGNKVAADELIKLLAICEDNFCRFPSSGRNRDA